jgi:hypothetical protein
MSYKHFPRYVKDFHGAANEFPDNIIIDLVNLCKKDAATEEKILTPLFQISQYPKLLVRFGTLATAHIGASLFGLSPILDKYLSKSDTDEWKQIVMQHITRIVPKKSMTQVVVYVKQRYKMSGTVRRNFEEGLKGKMGLDGGISWMKIVKYEGSDDMAPYLLGLSGMNDWPQVVLRITKDLGHVQLMIDPAPTNRSLNEEPYHAAYMVSEFKSFAQTFTHILMPIKVRTAALERHSLISARGCTIIVSTFPANTSSCSLTFSYLLLHNHHHTSCAGSILQTLGHT